MSVGRICVREVDTADAGESVQSAADRMSSRNVGTLVVISRTMQPVGIVTDRDLTIRVLAKGKDPYATSVAEVMSPFPKTVHENTPIEDALRIMRSGPCRRLPVVDDDERLVGLLSIDDVLDLLTEEFEQIGRLLKAEGPTTLAAR